jgi:hypothetical protein
MSAAVARSARRFAARAGVSDVFDVSDANAAANARAIRSR